MLALRIGNSGDLAGKRMIAVASRRQYGLVIKKKEIIADRKEIAKTIRARRNKEECRCFASAIEEVFQKERKPSLRDGNKKFHY